MLDCKHIFTLFGAEKNLIDLLTDSTEVDINELIVLRAGFPELIQLIVEALPLVLQEQLWRNAQTVHQEDFLHLQELRFLVFVLAIEAYDGSDQLDMLTNQSTSLGSLVEDSDTFLELFNIIFSIEQLGAIAC